MPPDHGYETPSDGKATTGAAVAAFGVRYAQLPGATRFDNSVLRMDRDTTASPPWDASAQLPGQPPTEQSWIMTHLPNYYGLENEWVDWLMALDSPVNRTVPKNSEQAASQLLYNKYAQLEVRQDTVYINTLDVPPEAYSLDLLGPIALKVKLQGQSELAVTADSDLKLVASYRDRWDHAVLMLGQPDQPRGRLPRGYFHVQIQIGQPQSDNWVDLGASTFSAYSVTQPSPEEVSADLEIYGKQSVDLVLPNFNVNAVKSDNPDVAVLGWNWDPIATRLSATVSGTNMQGERVHLLVTSAPLTEPADASP